MIFVLGDKHSNAWLNTKIDKIIKILKKNKKQEFNVLEFQLFDFK